MSESLIKTLARLESKITELEKVIVSVKNKKAEPAEPFDVEAEINKIVNIHFVNDLYRNKK
tara:strand:- start:302 stop:484 length:183 start_codon:yes stop_codon:yes gene_type:complete